MNINRCKGLLVHTLQRSFDISKGGISSRKTQFLLIDLQNPNLGAFSASEHDPGNILVLTRLSNRSQEYVYASPLDVDGEVIKGKPGGNFAYSSDSHFRREVCQYPISIHDRIEY
ncbi:hypothetical protein [Photobacterium sp. R1]